MRAHQFSTWHSHVINSLQLIVPYDRLCVRVHNIEMTCSSPVMLDFFFLHFFYSIFLCFQKKKQKKNRLKCYDSLMSIEDWTLSSKIRMRKRCVVHCAPYCVKRHLFKTFQFHNSHIATIVSHIHCPHSHSLSRGGKMRLNDHELYTYKWCVHTYCLPSSHTQLVILINWFFTPSFINYIWFVTVQKIYSIITLSLFDLFDVISK